MSDLISREALLEYARNRVGHTIDCNDIARFPAVDAEPVRYGRWFPVDGEAPCDEWNCTACGRRMTFMVDMDEDDMAETYWRCPKCGAYMCGAKMDGGAEDG